MGWFAVSIASIVNWRAIRQMRVVEKRYSKDFQWEFKNLIIQAQDVFERDRRARALEILMRAIAMFPDQAMGSVPALDLMLKLRLYDEAEALLRNGQRRFPNIAHCWEGLALVAYKRGNQEEALRHCDLLRRNFPDCTAGYWIAAASLSELGRAEEAETTLTRGLHRVPDDVGLRIEYARIAERRRDWPEALKRWKVVSETFGHLSGASGAADALKELGQYDEADQLLSDVLHKAGNDLGIRIVSARIAEHKQAWDEAADRWATVRKRFPLNPIGYVHGIRPLFELDRQEQADKILREGIDRIPDDQELFVEYATLAHRRGDWAEAALRWAVVRERFPDCRDGFERGSDALLALGDTDGASRIRLITST